jgi:transcriptional regulator
VFQGPHSYISPTWYAPPSVVPTWNYAAVHAYGRPTLIHDVEQLKAMVLQLVRFQEGNNIIPDLETAFPHHLMQAIVGMEIPIERLEGKFKFSQNKSTADQQGVIAALSKSEDSVQQAVAAIMRGNINT